MYASWIDSKVGFLSTSLPCEKINDLTLKQPLSYYEGMRAGKPRSSNLLRHALFFNANNNILVLDWVWLWWTLTEFFSVPVWVCVSHSSSKTSKLILPTKYFAQRHIPFRNSAMKLCFLSSQHLWLNILEVLLHILSWETCSTDLTGSWTKVVLIGKHSKDRHIIFHENSWRVKALYCATLTVLLRVWWYVLPNKT